MNCEQARKQIVESLAAGSAAGETISAHLNSCPDCRDFQDAQKSLFQAMDAGLHDLTNA